MGTIILFTLCTRLVLLFKQKLLLILFFNQKMLWVGSYYEQTKRYILFLTRLRILRLAPLPFRLDFNTLHSILTRT